MCVSTYTQMEDLRESVTSYNPLRDDQRSVLGWCLCALSPIGYELSRRKYHFNQSVKETETITTGTLSINVYT